MPEEVFSHFGQRVGFEKAWQILKDSFNHPQDTIEYEGFGPVPAKDYHNADWHMNHPHPRINSIADEMSRDELQAQLDHEKEQGYYPFGKPEQELDDPFRMEKPDMQSELEEMATEAGRREGRKGAKQEDEEDTDWPYSVSTFDSENPHNERLTNVMQPQMDERQRLLEEELARREDL